MTHTLSDTQVHQAAMVHAAKTRVSYSEALSSVVTLANYSDSNFIEHSNAVSLSDAKCHAAVMCYSAEHHVSYAEALACVTQVSQATQANFSDPARSADVPAGDLALDAAAHAYVREHRVSYSEALSAVGTIASHSEGSFSESAVGAEPLENASNAVESLMGQQIEIFRVGACIDNAGNTRNFTLEDIQATAASYSTAKHEAPLTLGHPGDNKPAYGWVKSLQATADGRLTMQAGQIEPAFAELVRAGRYKKRSASFYPPMHPSNPVPGVWYLKHLAWLGATAPALKGLPDANFSMQEPGMVSFEV